MWMFVGWIGLGTLLLATLILGMWAKLSRKAMIFLLTMLLLLTGPGIETTGKIYNSLNEFIQGKTSGFEMFKSIILTLAESWRLWDLKIKEYVDKGDFSAYGILILFCLSVEMTFLATTYYLIKGIIRIPPTSTWKMIWLHEILFVVISFSIGAIVTLGYPGLRELLYILLFGGPKTVTVGVNETQNVSVQ